MMVCSITSLRVMLNWRCSTSAWAVMAGFCLPGRCVSRLRAHAARPSWPTTFAFQLRFGDAWQISHPDRRRSLAEFIGARILAAAGIGAPERFFSMLRGIGLTLQTQALPDHFAWQCNPFIKVSADIILVTEKDAVKCRAGGDARFWAVPVHTTLDPRLLTLIMEKIRG